MSFRFRGCRIKISFGFFVLLAIAAIPVDGSALIYGLLAAILHELGHIAAALLSKARLTKLDITPFGLRMSCCDEQLSTARAVLVSSGGIIANLLTFFAAIALYGLTTQEHLQIFAYAGLIIGLLNLIPIEPLDGGRIFSLLLHRKLNSRTADRIITAVSVVMLVPMLTAGIWLLISSRQNYSLLILSLWLFIYLMRQWL